MENPLKNWRPPRRRRTKVEMSSFKNEIEQRLEIESPRQVSEWLKKKGEYISERSLRSYRNNIIGPRKALLRGTLFSKYHHLMNEKVDALQELYNLICVQIERLDMGLKVEQEKGSLSGMMSSNLDLLRRMLVDLIKVELDLGIRQRAGPKEEVINDDQLMDLLNGIIKKDAQKQGCCEDG